MSSSRRNFFQDAAVFTAGLFGVSTRLSAAATQSSVAPNDKSSPHHHTPATKTKSPAPSHAYPYVPVVTPDVPDLPFTLDGGTKVFRLRAEPVKRKIAPFKTIDAWGYNGSCPGPTIQVTQGDRVRIIVENALPESTSMHWHGLEVPIEQDGVPFISQKPIAPGETYTY